MHRLRAAVVLMLVAAALAPPPAAGGTAEDPELSDPAGDQAVTRTVPSQVPPIPQLTDDAFDDVDIVAAWFEPRLRAHGCADGSLDCPAVVLVVQTTGAWGSGTLTGSFTVERGPTSYVANNATGQTVSFTVQGTTVTGVANASAELGPEGLRVSLPTPRIGAAGGDLLVNLTLTATRTDPGLVTDPSATQDDATGMDTAGPGSAFTMDRPAPAPRVEAGIVRTGNATGNALTLQARATVPVQLRVFNLGTDPDEFTVTVASEPPLVEAPAVPSGPTALPLNGEATVTIPVSLAGMESGTVRVTFTVTTALGATDDAFANLVLALPQAERQPVPAGLDFLTPAAESVGFDDAFGEYAELALLALVVLVVILAIFLLVALAPSTLAGAATPESPPVAAAEEAPAGVLPAAAAKPADAPEEDDEADDAADAPVEGPLAIESVTHDPDAPEEGEAVTTEVLLRNPAGSRKVRVVLSVDGHDRDEKTLLLPARATKTVRLDWEAGPGENKVRVRVLPA